MSEVGVEIIKTEETKEIGIKYLNINVSNSEVERNPDIVRLCADAGILEYVKQKTGHWTERKKHEPTGFFLPTCSECGKIQPYTHHTFEWNFCPNCGTKMIDPWGIEE